MKMMRYSVIASLLMVSSIATAGGDADVAGATCVPDQTAIQKNLHANNNGGVGHA